MWLHQREVTLLPLPHPCRWLTQLPPASLGPSGSPFLVGLTHSHLALVMLPNREFLEQQGSILALVDQHFKPQGPLPTALPELWALAPTALASSTFQNRSVLLSPNLGSGDKSRESPPGGVCGTGQWGEAACRTPPPWSSSSWGKAGRLFGKACGQCRNCRRRGVAGEPTGFSERKRVSCLTGASFYKLVANQPSFFVSFLARNAILSQNICSLLDCIVFLQDLPFASL